jgi:methylated-DNA-[protein]-cysteine S-methyltransferase
MNQMNYTLAYESPLGEITVASDGANITGLWFVGQKYYLGEKSAPHTRRETAHSLPVFARVTEWLDCYFSGTEPSFTPPLAPHGTEFRLSVWNILTEIPYGEVITYGAIASKLAASKLAAHKLAAKTSARAVGGAVGHNPISIIVPCHRVAGADGSLTGYAGGIDKKIKLLNLEGFVQVKSKR